MSSILWFPIFIKAKIKECSSTRKTYIFGKQRPHVWPKFHADSDGTNGFWNFYDFVQNNPTTKFATFWANISVYNHAIGPEFDLMDSFFILHKMTLKVFKNLKILQNLGIKLESRQYFLIMLRNDMLRNNLDNVT